MYVHAYLLIDCTELNDYFLCLLLSRKGLFKRKLKGNRNRNRKENYPWETEAGINTKTILKFRKYIVLVDICPLRWALTARVSST